MNLVDYGIFISRCDNVAMIKRSLSQSIMQPEKKIKLTHDGVTLDDNRFLDDIKPTEIFVKLISDEEARQYVILRAVSLDDRIPDYIQVKKSDKASVFYKILNLEKCSAFYLLKDDGSDVSEDLTIEENHLVDNAPIYIFYDDVTVNVTNATGEESSFTFKITPNTTGLSLKKKVSSVVRIPEEKISLIITNAENTKFERIEDTQPLFKCAITDRSIIKWVEVQSLGGIEISQTPLNKPGSAVKVLKAKDKHKKWIALKEYNVDFGTKTISDSKALGNELINSWRLQGCDQSGKIVKMLGIYQDGPKLYFAMELMKESLRDVVDRKVCLTDSEVVKFTRQIIDGLMFLHGMKILHRNLKCSSVLLDDRGNVKLCSLGLAKYMIGNTDDEIIKGVKGSRVINYFWASPESLESSIWSVYSDVWSLGATVIEMRTGNKPYHKLTPYDASHLIMENKRVEYDRPSDMNEKQFKIFKEFVECCTDKKPEMRRKPNELLNLEYLNGGCRKSLSFFERIRAFFSWY